MNKQYWLVKSEPGEYSIQDLKKEGSTAWTGVRNFQARNTMRDQMKIGDLVLFYHSNTELTGVAGTAQVSSTPYPDPTAFDHHDKKFDPKSNPENPTWILVDLAFVSEFKQVITLNQIKADPALDGIVVAKKGMRLSVQPVSEEHYLCICSLGQK